MCGRVVDPDKRSAGLDTSWLKIDPFAGHRRYNVKPTQDLLILHDQKPMMARWWLIPSWFKGEAPKDWKAVTFNARIEDANEKPAFRGAWRYGRCLIPLGGFYEWTGPKGARQPWFFSSATNEANLYLAGLMSVWNDLRTCTIMTRPANESMNAVHDRMPVILNSEERDAWIVSAANTPPFLVSLEARGSAL